MSEKQITRPSARPAARSWWSPPVPPAWWWRAGLLTRDVSTRIIDKGDGVNLEAGRSLTGTPPNREDPMNRTRTPAGSAHHYPRPAQLSAAPASHSRSGRPYTRTLSSTEAPMMLFTCPAYLDQDSTVRCGLPAEVRCRFTMHSTGGPLDSVMTRCPAGHCFTGPIESLTWGRPDSTGSHDPGPAGLGSRAGRDSLQHGHDGRGGPVLRNFPAEQERTGRRPNTAPAYYLGHPAGLWITAMRPRRRPASRYLMEATVSGGNPARHAGMLRHS
jgi:hypothetical protein